MALSTTLYVTADTEVITGAYANDNRGTANEVWVGEELGGENTTSRGLFRFDLSSIASSTVVISSATLRLYAYGFSAGKNPNIYAYRTTSNWGEYTATWNNRPGYNQSFGNLTITNGSTGWKNITLSNSYVQYWARGTWSNYGFTLKAEDEIDDKVGFRSREYSSGTYRARLLIDYYDVPAVSTSSTSNIGTDRVTLNGNITNINGNNCTTRGFQYGLSETPTWNISQSGSYGTGSYSLTPTGLFSNKIYYFRAYATNAAGTTYGSWQSFQMPGLVGGMI